MAKEKSDTAGIGTDSGERILQLTIAANQIAACDSHFNAYEMRVWELKNI
jgi:hypothetical protein